MKNNIRYTLMLALALPFNACLGQVAEAPQKPAPPRSPKAPPAAPAPIPAPNIDASPLDMQAIKERAMEIADEARKVARDWQSSGVYERLQNVVTRVPAPNRSLVIPKDAADVKAMAENEEDLNIMARILDKVASSPDGTPRRAMGISVRTTFDGSPRNLYIDGYGAIFFLNVSYPLSAPPANTEKAEAKPEPPSEWDEARRELYQPGKGEAGNSTFEYKLAEIAGPPPEPYDADKVEQLQKSLITQLKNASHMRRLKSDETVTLMVSGAGNGPGRKVMVKKMFSNSGSSTTSSSSSGTTSITAGGGGGSGQGGGFVGGAPGRPASAEMRGNQMLLRASKADIEAFQNDKLSYDEFRKKVTILIY